MNKTKKKSKPKNTENKSLSDILYTIFYTSVLLFFFGISIHTISISFSDGYIFYGIMQIVLDVILACYAILELKDISTED